MEYILYAIIVSVVVIIGLVIYFLSQEEIDQSQYDILIMWSKDKSEIEQLIKKLFAKKNAITRSQYRKIFDLHRDLDDKERYVRQDVNQKKGRQGLFNSLYPDNKL